MDKEIKHAIFHALKEAMRRESAAFNFYIKSAAQSPYKETASVFLQLAEEERMHRRFIKKEIDRIQSVVKSEEQSDVDYGDHLSYQIPDSPDLRRIQPLPFVDMIMVSLPSELLSGDHLDTFIIEAQNQLSSLGIFLHDVMGHGSSSSHLNAMVKQYIGQELEKFHAGELELDFCRPDNLMTELNKHIVPSCQKDGRFITAFYGVLNYENKSFSYASAGQDPPLLIKKDGTYVHLDVTELVLGADQNLIYTSVDVPIDRGDVIVLFSDGLTEVCDKKEDMFERDRLIKSVQSAHRKTAKEIVNQIFYYLRAHAKGKPVTDDFSLAVLKIVEQFKIYIKGENHDSVF